MMEGLYPKYKVTKTADGSEVNDCFILKPKKDKAAVIALKAYIQATDNEKLKKAIMIWLDYLGVLEDNTEKVRILPDCNKCQYQGQRICLNCIGTQSCIMDYFEPKSVIE